MKVKAIAMAAVGLVSIWGTGAGVSRADTLYSQNFESYSTAAGSVDGWWNYFGPGNTTAAFGVDSNGVGGSQSLYLTLDSSAEIGTDWYFYAGVGRSNIATPSSVLPNARPEDLKFSIALSPNNANSSSTTPVSIELSQYNPTLAGNVWSMIWTPTMASSGYTNLAFTLDTGTDVPSGNIGGAASVFDPTLPITIGAITFNSGGFPLASGVGVHIDNVALSSFILGDANGDGHVDLTDLSTVLNNFGTSTGLRTSGNFDGASTVDLTDLSDVLNNFGSSDSSGGAASVALASPEPASIALLAAGSLLLVRRRSSARKM